MTNLRFQTWRQQHPEIKPHLHFSGGDTFGWGRVHAKWHEKRGGVDLTHICAFALDLQTGDIYLDCTIQKIWVKCLFFEYWAPHVGNS